MEPTLQRGDLIVCDSCGWDGEEIYALRMDGCGYVKRLARKPGKIVVISDNPKYEKIEGTMGDSHVGLHARLMSQALRKLTGVIKNSNTATIFINQLREKVGVMYGKFIFRMSLYFLSFYFKLTNGNGLVHSRRQ